MFVNHYTLYIKSAEFYYSYFKTILIGFSSLLENQTYTTSLLNLMDIILFFILHNYINLRKLYDADFFIYSIETK